MLFDNGSQQYNYLYAEGRYLNRLHAQKDGKFCDTKLTKYIKSSLSKRWSPEQIAGRIKLDHPENPSMRVSFCTIYRWIRLEYLGARMKQQLRRRGQGSRPKAKRFPSVNLIANRDPKVLHRQRIGDWEMDTLISAKRGLSGVLTMCDRKSRYCILVPTRNAKNQLRVFRTIQAVAEKLPCHTVTTDQGVEFSCYKMVESELNIPFYVCNPHSPWQKGSIENLNGLIREFFPKGTNFRDVALHEFQGAMTALNNRPRKCLNWKTPAEILLEDTGCQLDEDFGLACGNPVHMPREWSSP